MGNTESDEWFRVYRPGPGGVRLFCFPHAGGAASFFRPWSTSLPAGIEVLAVQYPGRQDRRAEPHARTIPDLADQIHAAIRSRLTEPFALFGHSMGAIVAFEVASRIERDGPVAPAHLFVSGRRAPSLVRQEELHRATTAAFIAEMRVLGGTDPRIFADPDLLGLVLPTVRADYRVIETYRYVQAAPLSVDVTAMVGDSDPRASVDEVAAWSQHTLGRFKLRVFPGGHFYLEDGRAAVLDEIVSVLCGVGDPGRRPGN